MGVLDWLRRKSASRPKAQPTSLRTTDEGDDAPEDEARHPMKILSGPDGVTVDGVTYSSMEEARKETRRG